MRPLGHMHSFPTDPSNNSKSLYSGDLGAIDAMYDIAVSTSCAALDYVVVDNTATAQCCVEMLRRKGLGVATFLILDKQQHLAKALQEKPSAPEGVLSGSYLLLYYDLCPSLLLYCSLLRQALSKHRLDKKAKVPTNQFAGQGDTTKHLSYVLMHFGDRSCTSPAEAHSASTVIQTLCPWTPCWHGHAAAVPVQVDCFLVRCVKNTAGLHCK